MSTPDPSTTSAPGSPWTLAYVNRRPWYRRLSQRMGLQAKLMVTFVLLIALTLGAYCVVSLIDLRAQMVSNLSAEARQTSTALAATTPSAFKSGTYRSLYTVSRELVRSSHNIVFVSFHRADGSTLISEAQGEKYTAAKLDVGATSALGVSTIRTDPRWGQFISCTQPIFGSGTDGIVGYVQVGLSFSQMTARVETMTQAALKVGAAILMLAIPTAWLIVRRIFLPIRLLVAATRRIVGGDLDGTVETNRPDVIGELARAFNEMVQTVKAQQQELRKANQQLGEANRDLESRIEQRTHQYETANKRLSVEIAEKEDFLRAVSHDLNAPLRNISGMVTMLLMKKRAQLDEDTIHRLDRIKKNVEVETDLINELLELSRIKTRRQAMENVDIEQMVWDLRGMFENDLKTRHIQLLVDTALPQLYCERARVRQVMQNLIDNAIKYMGEGATREIRVGCAMRFSEVEFYVRDTGLGIDEDDLGKVFFVFRRGKNTAAQNITGKGVGLASVKSIIETYSGKIWVESKPGEGSTFRFTINGQYVPATGGGPKAFAEVPDEESEMNAAA